MHLYACLTKWSDLQKNASQKSKQNANSIYFSQTTDKIFQNNLKAFLVCNPQVKNIANGYNVLTHIFIEHKLNYTPPSKADTKTNTF